MNLTSPRRSTPNDDENPVPVELPHVLVIVAADGTLTATVDGTPIPAPGDTVWTRTTFGPLMDAITKDRAVAVRVEVRECDGSVFTDIIRPRTPRRAAPLSEKPVPETRRSRHARRVPRLMEVTADGFAALSSTVLSGRTVLRLCTINPATSDDDLRRTVALVADVASRVGGGGDGSPR